MTIEDLGRSAARAARHKATQEVEPTMMLRKLHRTNRRRTLAAVTGAAVAVAVVGVLVVRGLAPSSSGQAPGAAASSAVPSTVCPEDVTCLGSNRFRVDLPVSVTVTVPASFQSSVNRLGADAAEGYRADVGTTGVTILENATAVRNDTSWTADPAAGTTASSMAVWLSKRPFLADGTVVRTTVDGYDAWRVTGTLRAGAPLLAVKDGDAAAPTFKDKDAGATAGFTRQITGQYTLLDLPGAGVTVIWSWTLGHAATVLAGNQAFIDNLTFG